MIAPRLEWWQSHDDLISLARWMHEIGRFVTCDQIIDFFEKPYVWGDTREDFETQKLIDMVETRHGEDAAHAWDIRDEDGDFFEEHPVGDQSHIIRNASCLLCPERATARNNQTRETYCYDHLQEVLGG